MSAPHAIPRTSCTSASVWPAAPIARMSGFMGSMRAPTCRSPSIPAVRRLSLRAAFQPSSMRVSRFSGRMGVLRSNRPGLPTSAPICLSAGTRVALAPSGSDGAPWTPAVWLVSALNNDAGVRVARGQARARRGRGALGFQRCRRQRRTRSTRASCISGSKWMGYAPTPTSGPTAWTPGPTCRTRMCCWVTARSVWLEAGSWKLRTRNVCGACVMATKQGWFPSSAGPSFFVLRLLSFVRLQEALMTRIVADTTCGLDPDVARQLGIPMISQIINFRRGVVSGRCGHGSRDVHGPAEGWPRAAQDRRTVSRRLHPGVHRGLARWR